MAEQRIVPFVFEGEQTVRVLERENEPWFVASDVCRVIGVKDVGEAIERLDEDERGRGLTPTPGGHQEMLIISEGGLYTLILRSRDAVKPGTVAHRFRRWITGEVLPQIRRTGRYNLASGRYEMAADAAKLRQVMAVKSLFGDAAARKLYVQLGLQATPEMRQASQGELFEGDRA